MTTDERILAWLAVTNREWTIDKLRIVLAVPRREIEAAIEALRLAGNPIIADATGVRLTNDPSELAAYIDARRRRLVSQYRGTRALRQTWRRMQRPTLFPELA